jgi:hypothetical protein
VVEEYIMAEADNFSKNKKQSKKKGKNGQKLSQQEINNLSTEELLNYI